jgi:Flp pilus assembly protein TadG
MLFDALRKTFRALRSDRRGNVAILSALALPMLIGMMGIGAEVGSWYEGKRGLQNAADSAAIAAATNGSDDSYDDEARAVAAQYGFTDGMSGMTVTAQNNQPCPAGGDDECYRVTISRLQPLFLAQVVGFKGDVMVDGTPYKRISSTALAIQGEGPRQYCILTLATNGDALRTNGAPFADLSGCNTMSNADSTCVGHDLKADVGDAAGVNNGCGKKKNSHVDPLEDPFSELAENIPTVGDTDCPEAPVKKKDPPLPSKNLMSGPMTENKLVCGDVQLNGPLFVTEPNTLLVIKDGSLDLKGFTLMTQPGASLTVIFTGTENRTHAQIGNGKFDIAAPTDGVWKGVAMYQDPETTHGVDVTEAGNQPTWNITGLVYMPHADVTFSGAVSKASGGKSCFALVVNTLLINGTGSILNHGECKEAGLTLPEGKAPSRGELVS